MAQFDESKVINALHPEKAEVGKKYWIADELLDLKRDVEKENAPYVLKEVDKGYSLPFVFNLIKVQFLYPYEEPPKQRMTNIQFMEWLAKGNGLCSSVGSSMTITDKSCLKIDLDNEVETDVRIRPWDSDEWIEPTLDIYERDVKVVRNDK